MEEAVQRALARGHLIDITTTGRRSGRPHRVEVVFHTFDGRIYISGLPGRRDWYANLVAHPHFTLHLKRLARADLPAVARPIRGAAERQAVIERIARVWRRVDVDRMIASSPLVEVTFDGDAGADAS
jgi:deazaflavin-dependent oxidoreductase (nitroreductase family)